jgi:4-carboxymuconolactone decarboxylase
MPRHDARHLKRKGGDAMAKAPPSAKPDRIKSFTPALVDYTNEVVYGDLWERKALSKRDRSLITVAALVATYRPEQLVSPPSRAIANGVTQEEITEVIAHMAFYASWPAAMSAAQVAYTVLVEGDEGVRQHHVAHCGEDASFDQPGGNVRGCGHVTDQPASNPVVQTPLVVHQP